MNNQTEAHDDASAVPLQSSELASAVAESAAAGVLEIEDLKTVVAGAAEALDAAASRPTGSTEGSDGPNAFAELSSGAAQALGQRIEEAWVRPVAQVPLREELDQFSAQWEQAVAVFRADLEQLGPQGHDVAREAVPFVDVRRRGVPQVGMEEPEVSQTVFVSLVAPLTLLQAQLTLALPPPSKEST